MEGGYPQNFQVSMYRLIAATFLFLITSLFSYEEIQDKRKLEILSPSLKEQRSAKIRLGNGLEALVISDPDTNKAGAVLTVLAGSWSDPLEHPGMAHFLEHMLFMGTEEYPDESEYQRFIHDHGGEANAFTIDTATSYMFSIDPDYLDEALLRFSSFFKKPLLNTSQVERELKAIDQEYGKNIENDDIRELFVHKSLLNPKHPSIQFSMGNSSTLKNVTKNELRDFYETHYSANLMRLIVVGKEPINQLTALVESAFKGVPNKNIESFTPVEVLSNPEYKGKLVVIEPIKDVRTLSLVFEIPKRFVDKELKPYTLISHILGHEGEGSLLSVLKEKNLAESLSTSELSTGDNSVEFSIEVGLTENGVLNWQEVLLLTFQAIKTLSQEQIPSYIFEDLQAIQKIEYQFQTRKDVFSDLMKKGMQLANESIDTFPEQTLILNQFNPKITQEVAKTLTLDNAYIYMKAKLDSLPFKPNQKEKWVGSSFGIYSLPKDLIKAIENVKPSREFQLPKQNPFLPKDFNLRMKEDEFSQKSIIPLPKALIDNQSARIFFAQEHDFQEPKCALSFLVRNSKITPKDARSIVLSELYVKALNDQLNPFVYPAQIAGLNFSIKKADQGFTFTVLGHSDTCDTLFTFITDVIDSKKLPFQRFSQYKNRLMTDYQNATFYTPVQMSLLLKASLFKFFPLPEEKARILAQITETDLQNFTETLFSEGYVEGIIVGNLSSKEALIIASRAQTVFAKSPLTEPYYQLEVLDLKNTQPLFLEQEIAAQGNATLLVIETPPPYSLKMRAIHQILTQAIQEPFYSNLRTKQQTGYIVQSFGEEIERRLFNLFLAQSNTHSPGDLLARFELFLEGFLQELRHEELTNSRFEAIRGSLLFDLKNPVKNLAQVADLLSNLLFLYNGDFHWVEKRIEAMQNLSYEECLQGIKAILGKENSRRFAILLTGKTGQAPFFFYKKVDSLDSFKKEEEYNPKSL